MIRLIVFGKSREQDIEGLQEIYNNRIKKEINFELIKINSKWNNQSRDYHLDKEAQALNRYIVTKGIHCLLDEKGMGKTSVDLAQWVQECGNNSLDMNFYIGGAYGFSEEVKQKVKMKLKLSDFTLPHQLARIVFLEQLYRVTTIIKGHPYHNP